jgi:LPXTG-motif cell wall-anchored protein
MRTTHTHARRRPAGLIAILALLLSAIVGAGAATAAPPYTTEATITSVDFRVEEVTSGSTAQLDLTWELADHPASPAGFVVDLPKALQGHVDSFPLLDAHGTAMGACTVTAARVYCDLDAEYLAENPLNISGGLSFWVKVRTEVTERTEVTYDVEGVEATITVNPPSSGTCVENCEFTGRGSYKWGSYDTATDTASWHVVVKAPAQGMAGGQQLTVTDRVGAGQEITSVRVRHTDTLVIDGNGREAPGRYVTMDPSGYAVSDDLSTVTLTTEQGFFYVVDYVTAITDGGTSATYTNEADITIAGETTKTVRAEVINKGGAGTGSGTNVGAFTITKEVLGAAEAAAGMTFTGSYAVTTPGGNVREGTFEVTDGQTWTSPDFPRGSTVHLTEATPAGPANVSWAAPAFSENDFTLGSGTLTAVTLTNEATLLTGAFSIAKVIEGDGAALVPVETTFVVTYSYPAGPGYEAGSGELLVPADGSVVESPQLPAGAVLTLTELDPAAIAGLTWDAPQFTTDSVTVAAGEVTAVQLTNTASATPPADPPTTAEPDASSTVWPAPTDPVETEVAPAVASSGTLVQQQLAETGTDQGRESLAAALVLVLLGAALLAVRRRRAI